MVSRLYASTRSLWEQVDQAFARLGIGRGRPRRWVELMILNPTRTPLGSLAPLAVDNSDSTSFL